jgi:hypothetical protein
MSALVHGDAHPGNFFWDPTAGITFIDTPTFHYSMDVNGMPIASPERDISNFIQRLAHYGRVFKLHPEEIARLHDTFVNSYRDAGGAPLDHDTMRMFGARSVLNKLLQIGDEIRAMLDATDASEEVDQGALARLDKEMRSEIGLLKRALGWDE